MPAGPITDVDSCGRKKKLRNNFPAPTWNSLIRSEYRCQRFRNEKRNANQTRHTQSEAPWRVSLSSEFSVLARTVPKTCQLRRRVVELIFSPRQKKYHQAFRKWLKTETQIKTHEKSAKLICFSVSARCCGADRVESLCAVASCRSFSRLFPVQKKKKKKKKPNGGCHTKLERSPFYTASEESSTLKCLPRKARQTSHRLNIVHESSRGEIHWYKTLPVRFRLKKKQKNLKNTSTADTSLYCPSKQERGAKKHRRKRGRKNTVENGAEKTQ